MTERYAWGVATLVHMYDQLNDASMSHSRQLGGYITLLQCWIYEHFPSVAESTADRDYDETSPRACKWIATKKTVKSIRTPSYRERLDRLRIPDVCWIPYGEHREFRDFHEVCDDIAKRLERHLSLGVVTPGSSTHEVIEECLRLARSEEGEIGTTLGSNNEPSNSFPDEFYRIQNNGIVITNWAPQLDILKHPSIGGFVSHCGWNSLTESVSCGVPIIGLPLFGEQMMSATMRVTFHFW
ncbi:UDP-glucose:2-hydroxyflavanone C-glucosyltransferase-like [Glycine soja]|uniref:UDP-glucose:2-hydroxyflavanone C-glucosyltransferase-like n=1 Tax=Glycine soja TaxID=3848 RepID=UPI00103A1CA7|nr:UDP-glucose:2-hydroxyflavanone C-glucosyltransferase-like [Glycine soja]